MTGISYPFNIGTTYTAPSTYTVPASYTVTSSITAKDDSLLVTGSSTLKGDCVIHGDCDVHGDLTIDGKSLKDTLDNIESRLAILHPNKKLEEKWERLKALGDMYRELEREIIEKEQIWSTLKK